MTCYLHRSRHSLGTHSFFLWLLVAASFLLSLPTSAQSLVLPYNWHINGEVRAMEQDGNNLYLGGMFTMIGPLYERAQTFNTTTGTAQWSHNMGVNGDIRVSIPDGAGGWYIGGGFTSVLGQTRNCLARINADGTLHSWNPDVSSSSAYIYALALNGSAVYVGGNFSTIGGVSRNNFAAVDASTGTVGSLDLNANSSVRAFLVQGTVLYIGGGLPPSAVLRATALPPLTLLQAPL
ncbi:hypothetical protein [Paraflavitalea speifideaquila]|uniref:hypothetical protein n=1 Tax=Paraflavitalea speifideaquila TaxID=3076558 RepID=UPI0028E6BA61|nr:hypothetical protein [Paraflavitalea speifideiaquila]